MRKLAMKRFCATAFFAILAKVAIVTLAICTIVYAQQSAPLSNGDANTIQIGAAAMAAIWNAASNASAAILNLQTKLAADETKLTSVQTQANTSTSTLSSLQSQVLALQAQLAAQPAMLDGVATLAAGTATVVFSKPFTSAPKCAIGATASPALTITPPTTTGFTITSSTPTDTQAVDWICRQ